MILVVTGLPAAGKTTLARALAAALRTPMFSLDAIKEALYDALRGGAGQPPGPSAGELRFAAEAVLGALLADARSGAVIDIWLDPTRGDRERLRTMLPADVPSLEIFCDVSAETAGRRYGERRRHTMHRGADAALLSRIVEAAGLLEPDGTASPAGLGPVRRVDTSEEVDVSELVSWVRRTVTGS